MRLLFLCVIGGGIGYCQNGQAAEEGAEGLHSPLHEDYHEPQSLSSAETRVGEIENYLLSIAPSWYRGLTHQAQGEFLQSFLRKEHILRDHSLTSRHKAELLLDLLREEHILEERDLTPEGQIHFLATLLQRGYIKRDSAVTLEEQAESLQHLLKEELSQEEFLKKGYVLSDGSFVLESHIDLLQTLIDAGHLSEIDGDLPSEVEILSLKS